MLVFRTWLNFEQKVEPIDYIVGNFFMRILDLDHLVVEFSWSGHASSVKVDIANHSTLNIFEDFAKSLALIFII